MFRSFGFWLINRTIHSPFGQVLKAIRENEPRAVSLGYNVNDYKWVAFMISAALAGLAGYQWARASVAQDIYRDRLHKLTCRFPISDNYFAWQAYGRRYDLENRQALPDYLREENYQTLRDGIDRVESHVTSLDGYLNEQGDDTMNRFVLLDAQDWMPPHVIATLWEQIARVGQPGSRIIFRTAGFESPIEAALPAELRKRFVYERELSEQLHDQDRSAIYGMFHIYSMPQ